MKTHVQEPSKAQGAAPTEEQRRQQEEAFEKEMRDYRALKTEKWGMQGVPEDPSAPVSLAALCNTV